MILQMTRKMFRVFCLKKKIQKNTKWSRMCTVSRPVARGGGVRCNPPKSAKRSTFSHKVGQKWGFCRRVRGVRFKKVHFLGVPHPSKSILATGLTVSYLSFLSPGCTTELWRLKQILKKFWPFWGHFSLSAPLQTLVATTSLSSSRKGSCTCQF